MTRTASTATTLTPIGPFTAILDADGAVLASGWTADVAALTGLIHPTLRPPEVVEHGELGSVTVAILAYHAGQIETIDSIAVQQISGEFTTHAWKVLRTVEPGRPVTYSEYATLSGRPAAVRAAAAACAKNPAALFVPCHRVLRLDGGLGGFRWGLDAKRWLLAHESRSIAPEI